MRLKILKVAKDWKDYVVLATGDGEKLEKWGKYVLLRPDPQIIWHGQKDLTKVCKIDGHYFRDSHGGGKWNFFSQPTGEWTSS